MKENVLTLSKYITPGIRAEIQAIERVLQPDGSYGRKLYTSKVYDVLDEDRLEIFMPIEQSKLILLPVNGEYELHFFTGKGLFQCLARVVQRYKSGNIYLLEMELASNLQKYQRREYYRYSCVMDLLSRQLQEEEEEIIQRQMNTALKELPFDKCTIVDISGGGVRMVAPLSYEIGKHVLCEFTLMIQSKPKQYSVLSEILACNELENQKGQYEHRVKFIRIDNSEREEIIRYIFEEERKKRQRER